MMRMTGSGRIPWLAWSGNVSAHKLGSHNTEAPGNSPGPIHFFTYSKTCLGVGGSGSPSVGPMRIVVLALSAWLELVCRLRHGEACAQHRSVPVGSSRLHPRVHKLFCQALLTTARRA